MNNDAASCNPLLRVTMLFRRRIPKKSGIIPIKGGIIAKAAILANRRWLFSQGKLFLRQKQPLFQNVFFWRLVKLSLKQSEQIALADK